MPGIASTVLDWSIAGLPLVRKAKKKLNVDLGPNAGLELIDKSLSENWATGEMLEVLIERRSMIKRTERDPSAQAEEMRLCFQGDYMEGLKRFFRLFLNTFDPRLKKGKVRPFILFEKQVELLQFLEDRYNEQADGIVKKSRDMGFSWVAVGWALYHWLREDGFTCLFLSNLTRNVDTLGDPKSIFEKIRTAFKYLPTWMKPGGFRSKLHSLRNRFINPANGASIIGEGGKEAGRSGRASIAIVDEAAHIEQAESVENALSGTTDCRIFGSSPRGIGNLFHRKWISDEFPRLEMLWLDDPRRNAFYMRRAEDGTAMPVYPWYERQKRRFVASPLTLAQEIDARFESSIEDVVFPVDWIYACIGIDLPASDFVSAGFDVGETGDDCALVIRRGPVVTLVMTWTDKNTTQSARKVVRTCEDHNTAYLAYDSNGMGAGVTGEIVSGSRKPRFRFDGWKWGERASKLKWPNRKRSFEMFENSKAEHHWLLRERMRKTYEHSLWIKGDKTGVRHNVDELLSLPKPKESAAGRQDYIDEFSTVRFEERANYKIRIESKKAMRTRGVSSPNMVDATVLAFAPERERQLPTSSTSKPTY